MGNKNDVKYAGFFTRLLATLVDIAVVSFVVNVMERVITLDTFVALAVWWLYVAIMLTRWRTTIGGKLFGIEVLKSDSLKPLNFKWASARFFISITPFLLYLYLRGMQHIMDIPPSPTMSQLPQLIFMLLPMIMFFTKKKQMIHDFVAGSVVIDVNVQTNIDGTKKNKVVHVGQKILRMLGTLVFLAIFGYLLIYVSVFYKLGKSSQNRYDASFQTIYKPNDYNNSKIIFYKKELEQANEKFVDAESMYEIFEADVKKDLALGCIRYFIKREGNENWLDEGATHRVSARNKYANTEDKIKKAKKNSDYMGKHFYTFDLNIVNHVVDDVTEVWSDKNESICEKQLSSYELYEIFIPKYISKFDDENIHSQFGTKPQQREIDWYELLKVKRNDIFKKISIEKEKRKKEEKKLHDEWMAKKVAEKQKKERLKFEKKLLKKRRKEEKIINQQKKVYESDIKRGVPPIFAAIQNHMHNQLRLILDMGADVNMQHKGVAPLIFAIYQNDDKLVEILLKYGANPNFLDGFYSPLSKACVTNRVSTVKLLLKYGADVNYQYNNSESALRVAAKGCDNFELVRLLLDNGANLNLTDASGVNIVESLYIHCRNNKQDHKKMLKLIYEYTSEKYPNRLTN